MSVDSAQGFELGSSCSHRARRIKFAAASTIQDRFSSSDRALMQWVRRSSYIYLSVHEQTGPFQFKAFVSSSLSYFMWNEPSSEELDRLPRLYATEKSNLADKVIQKHFFLGGCDWYMAEYCPQDRLFFGYAILNADHQNAEWGYTSLDELLRLNVRSIEVDRDLHWKPKRFVEI